MSDVLDDLRCYGEAVQRAAVEHAAVRRPVAQPEDVESDEDRHSRRHLAVTATAIAVFLLGALALGWRFHRDDQAERVVIVDQPTTSMTGSPAPTDSGPTPEQIEEAEAALDVLHEQEANVWVPYGGRSAIPSLPAPEGWVRSNAIGELEPTYDEEGHVVGQRLLRKPVFDRPDGTIIGYHFPNVGFVPADQADTFDATAARIELFGCDTQDPDCIPNLEHTVPTTAGGGG